ncbi:outer membrane protein assembly factor BamA [Sulfurisoma sediminicola]|uniref:Outer membrane protein assembly factor BamA n=1 Tax=Sulfurisoma sediminicola TaxID=1381557 RepID=A0A497XDS1_9PROT|nr:Beta-barrel assembly machine subunit BamA [Sulfurisoma sediminicola]
MNNKLMTGVLSSMAALTAALGLALAASPALAFNPFPVKDIRIEGIQRTEAGTVFSYLPVKVGDTMTDDKAAQAIKALFGTGFFKDVRIEIDNDVVVVIVEERPAIASIDFNGLKAFKKEDLLKGLKEVGLAESRIFDRALIERAEQELKRQYLAQGYYAVSLTTTVTPLERNRVGISVTVDEGDIAKIRQINIVGAKAFKESELLGLFTLTTPGIMTWYTKNDQYSKQKLSADIESLRSFYLDRGYMEFNVESTQVQISPSKQDIYITINMSEGEKYTVASVKLAGNLMLPEAELTKLVLVKPGDVFSREKMTETTKAISERLGNEGYAFANVNAAPELDKAKRTAAFTIYIDPGRRVYVRRIGVTGNSKTRDEVIRREMRQLEASWYDGEKINKSKKRVDRLGYFEEVTVETPPVPGTTDQVDVNVNVKEKPTGNVSLGAGYSSTEGMTFSTAIQQENMFGSGRHIGFAINTSKVNTLYSLSYTNPYWTVDGTAFGFDVYHRDLDTSSLDVGSFGSRATGGGFRLGLPISEENFVNLGLSGDRTKLKVNSSSPIQYQNYVRDFGEYQNTVLTTASWSRDTVDSRIWPMRGFVGRVGGEISLPAGNVKYWKVNLGYTQFVPIGRDYALKLNGELGSGDGYSDKPLPFFKNFYAGGIGSVRGYRAGSIGPYDPVTDQHLGGIHRVVGNAEFLFPMPGMGKDRSLRMSAFIDGGRVWGNSKNMTVPNPENDGGARYSGGLGAAWTSPVGPLKFSVATPLNKKDGDKTETFQFTMGTTF